MHSYSVDQKKRKSISNRLRAKHIDRRSGIDLTELYRGTMLYCNYAPSKKIYGISRSVALEETSDEDDDKMDESTIDEIHNHPYDSYPSSIQSWLSPRREYIDNDDNDNHVKDVNKTDIKTVDKRTTVEKELDKLAAIATVRSWISYECRLPQYFKPLIQNGFNSMCKIIHELNNESLDKIMVLSHWERAIILLKIKKYKQELTHKS